MPAGQRKCNVCAKLRFGLRPRARHSSGISLCTQVTLVLLFAVVAVAVVVDGSDGSAIAAVTVLAIKENLLLFITPQSLVDKGVQVDCCL